MPGRGAGVLAALILLGLPCATLADTPVAEDQVRIMTFNILRGGTELGQPISQTAKVITEGGADVVGLQEAGRNVEALAESLGWNLIRQDQGRAILTRHEIADGGHGSATIRLASGREFHVFNVHLPPAPYQPYQLLGIPYGNAPFIKTEAEAIASAGKARGRQVAALLEQARAFGDESVPVFVVGDFNEPSHLDWTEAAAKLGRHPIKVAFPTSLAMKRAGFVDAWRHDHPDESGKPGFTWTPLTKPGDPNDHHDRIDFIYFRGKGAKLDRVAVVGEDREHADVVVAPYPSDHRAVVACFTLSHAGASDKGWR
jgi:endonuclease/exonuclease/phosphatase family metal-dependent hydrolase